MLEKIPKTVPIDFGTSHGNELLNFFDTCRRRGIGTDIELTVNGEKLKGISFIQWKIRISWIFSFQIMTKIIRKGMNQSYLESVIYSTI